MKTDRSAKKFRLIIFIHLRIWICLLIKLIFFFVFNSFLFFYFFFRFPFFCVDTFEKCYSWNFIFLSFTFIFKFNSHISVADSENKTWNSWLQQSVITPLSVFLNRKRNLTLWFNVVTCSYFIPVWLLWYSHCKNWNLSENLSYF